MEVVLIVIVFVQLLSDVQAVKNGTFVSTNDSHQREFPGGSKLNDNKRFNLIEEYMLKQLSLPYPFPINSTCKLHSDMVVEEANKLNIWALKIIDATAKIPSGILNGNLNQYGDFDECLSANLESENIHVHGKYCLSTISITFENTKCRKNLQLIDDLVHANRMIRNNLNDAGHRIPKLETFNWGVCVPNSCTNTDLQQALQIKLDELIDMKDIKMNVLINDNMCFEEGERRFTTINKVALLFFAFMILLAIVATLVDKYSFNRRKFVNYLTCFSFKKNLSILFKTDQAKDEITVMHGARFLNAIALLLSHKQMALMFNPTMNRTEMSEILGKPWSMIGRSAILYTDTFILMSGLLLSYSLIKELDEKRRINFKERLISRLVRFTPNLFALVIFCTFIIEHLGSGPQWGLVVNQYADLCKKNMWKNFFFIHNYFGFEEMCLTHTHQLGIDMQLFIISPFVIYALWRNSKRGFMLLFMLGMASTYLRYYVTEREHLSTLIYFGISVDRLWKTATKSYILPTHRLTVYLAGTALGYFLRRNGRQLRLTYSFRLMGWILAVTSGVIAMFGPYHISSKDYTYNVMDAALYNAISPILWVIFLSWSIIACENGWGGWFYKFLSWKYFAIFTRISYAVYLTQFPVFFYGVGTQRSPYFFRGFHSMFDLPEFLLIFVLSLLMTLLFDLPCQNLRKTYLCYSKARHKKEFVSSEVLGRVNHMSGRRRLDAHGD